MRRMVAEVPSHRHVCAVCKHPYRCSVQTRRRLTCAPTTCTVLFVDAVLVTHCVVIGMFVALEWHTMYDVNSTLMASLIYGAIVVATAVISVIQHAALWHTTSSHCCCDHVTHAAIVV